MNISGVGETGVGEMGQIIGETGIGEMGVGETETTQLHTSRPNYHFFNTILCRQNHYIS